MTETRNPPEPEDVEREAIEAAFDEASKPGTEHERLVRCFLRGAQWEHGVTAGLLSDALGGSDNA